MKQEITQKENKKEANGEIPSDYEWNKPIEPPKKSIFRKILEAVGMGGLIAGYVGFSGVMLILQIIFVWGTGIGMIYYGVSLLIHGFIFWGLIVLFVGTPVAVAIAQFLFPFWIILLIIGLIIALIRWIF